MQYIDLSVVLNEQTPLYPGDPATKLTPSLTLQADGSNDHYLSIDTHTGTHIDAPFHKLADGKTLDEFPLTAFIGRGRLINVRDKPITLESVQAAAIAAGDIVFFYTGMADHYYEPAYYTDFPAFPKEVADYLVELGIKMMGVDMCGVDHEGSVIHETFLKKEVLIIENLTNLGALEGKDFTVYALPIKLQVDGAPARVIAQV